MKHDPIAVVVGRLRHDSFTPEDNRSIPGVRKNALDHASRPYGQGAWTGKSARVLGVSVGAIGTAGAQQHWRNVLAWIKMHAARCAVC